MYPSADFFEFRSARVEEDELPDVGLGCLQGVYVSELGVVERGVMEW